MFVSVTASGASAAPDPGWPNATIYSLNSGPVAPRQHPDPSASLANHHSAQTVGTAIFRNRLVIPENADSYTFVCFHYCHTLSLLYKRLPFVFCSRCDEEVLHLMKSIKIAHRNMVAIKYNYNLGR